MTVILLGIAVTATSIIFLVRATLILVGYLKDPILRTFSEYGPREKLYMPGQQLLLWGGVLSFCAGLWAAPYQGLSATLTTFGILMGVVVAIGYTYAEQAEKIHLKILKYPLWYHDLRERTTRYERRRIAYMWLHLPWRLRLLYNSSDSSFFIWADFVIMGTIREEESEVFDEHFYAGR